MRFCNFGLVGGGVASVKRPLGTFLLRYVISDDVDFIAGGHLDVRRLYMRGSNNFRADLDAKYYENYDGIEDLQVITFNSKFKRKK